MGASMFSGRLVLIILVVAIGGAFGMGYLHWNSDKVKCFQKRYWTKGNWHTIYAVGKLELRYKNVSYMCDPEWKLDPKEFHKNTMGEIVPLEDPQLTE